MVYMECMEKLREAVLISKQVRIVSNELLNTINGFVDYIELDPNFPEASRDDLKMVSEAVWRLKNAIRKLDEIRA